MHSRASSSPGATIAWVGQAVMQRVQVPQRSGAGKSAVRSSFVKSSLAKSSELRITPSNSHDPSCWLMMHVFLPIHPMPAYLASPAPMTGPVQTEEGEAHVP